MKHTHALEVATGPKCIRREKWTDLKKKIRPAHEGDMDYIGITETEGVLVEDCPKPMDCSIRVYNLTEDDKKAEDWVLVACNSEIAQ